MPSEGQRLHPFGVVSRGLRIARRLLLPALLGGISAGGGIESTATWILLILSIPSLLVAVAQWLVFRFRLEGEELILDSGVLARRRRVIPIARIQNIDMEQTPLERLVGVAELRLETASGGGETEARLDVLPVDEARALQQDLLRRRELARQRRGSAASVPEGGAAVATPEPTAAAPPVGSPAPVDYTAAEAAEIGEHPAESQPPRVLLRLGMADLAIAGATSNEAGLIAAGLATLLQVGSDLAGMERFGDWVDALVGRGVQMGLAGGLVAAVVLIVAFIVAGWLVSIVATVVRYHGFTLTRSGTDLRREYGLLTRHHTTVPLERVQAVRIEETLLRRPLGLAALKIETAGARPQQNQGQGGGGAEAFVPIARRQDVGRLLREVFEEAHFEGTEMHPVSPLSRRRAFVRLGGPVVLAVGILTAVVSTEWLWLLLLLAPAALLAHAQYRARAWGRPRGFVIARTGVLTRLTWLVPVWKIQTLHARETPFQRRVHLATLLIDTAAGGRVARIVDLDRDRGLSLLAGLGTEARAARRARTVAASAGAATA